MKESRAVVWDLDGVIVDSAEAHNASWAEMASEYGLPYDPQRDFKSIFGRHNTDIISQLWGVTRPDEIERMALKKETSFRRAASGLRALPGVLELMVALQEAGWRQAIGSSAPLVNIHLLLRTSGGAPYIEAIASGEDVTEGKPNPEVFLLAFERLGVSPMLGVVIEDSPAGILGAVRAGAAALGVTTTQTEQSLKEAGAHRVVGSLREISAADLEALVRENQERLA